MSFVVDKQGNISLFRVGTIVAVVGVLLVGGGVLAYFLDQNSFKTPLVVEPYPGAEVWGEARTSGVTSRALFRIPGATADEVAAYYQQKLQSFDAASEGCIRTPATGTFVNSQTDRTIPPFTFKCLFQRTGLNASQLTTITIQPGVFNADPTQDTTGMTVVEHNQRWQP